MSTQSPEELQAAYMRDETPETALEYETEPEPEPVAKVEVSKPAVPKVVSPPVSPTRSLGEKVVSPLVSPTRSLGEKVVSPPVSPTRSLGEKVVSPLVSPTHSLGEKAAKLRYLEARRQIKENQKAELWDLRNQLQVVSEEKAALERKCHDYLTEAQAARAQHEEHLEAGVQAAQAQKALMKQAAQAQNKLEQQAATAKKKALTMESRNQMKTVPI